MKTRTLYSAALAIALCLSTTHAQSPAPPTVVSPATAAPQLAGNPADDAAATLKLLQTMKAANEETLKRQMSTLQQLDELEKAADQLKVFSRRS